MSTDPDQAEGDGALGAAGRLITAAREAHAKHLAHLRKRAGYTQDQLGRRIGFSRSAVANAESGHMTASRRFWEGADRLLKAGGALVAKYDELQVAADHHAKLLEEGQLRRFVDQSVRAEPAGLALSPHDAVVGAGLRVFSAVVDLLNAVRDTVDPAVRGQGTEREPAAEE